MIVHHFVDREFRCFFSSFGVFSATVRYSAVMQISVKGEKMLNLARRGARPAMRGAVSSTVRHLHLAASSTVVRSWWSDGGERQSFVGSSAAAMIAAAAAAAVAAAAGVASSDRPAWAEGEGGSAAGGSSSRGPWEASLEKCIPAVVSIKVACQTTAVIEPKKSTHKHSFET